MTDYLAIARECGAFWATRADGSRTTAEFTEAALSAFAERVRQDERERFAKIGRRAMLAMKRAYPHMDESAHAEYAELDDARSELQAALGRDGEHCMCEACRGGLIHASCCAVHNEPAMPNGPCDCGVLAQQVPERAE
jgi:hypothetical protein